MNPSFVRVLSVFFISTVSSTDVSSCNSVPLPEVEIKDCATPPCVFFKNSTAIMALKFKSPRDLEHIAPRAKALLAGLEIPYRLEQENACEGVTNTGCPLTEGQDVEYTFEMFILPVFPAITVRMEFSLVDQDQNSEAFECFTVVIQIADLL